MINKKKKNKGLIILSILFSIYLIVLYSKSNGYYDYKEYNKMKMTDEAMKKFEEDVKNGENIDINSYIDNTYKDYSNSLTKMGTKFGNISKDLMTNGFTKIIKVLEKLFT